MILVIGDAIVDEYTELTSVRPCSEGDWPIVSGTTRSQLGGANAVVEMVRSLGVRSVALTASYFGMPNTVKRRVSVDGKTVYRQDFDRMDDFSRKVANQIIFLDVEPECVLVSDYSKGAIGRCVIDACLARNWKVIVDPHHDTLPSTYYGCYGITPNRNENLIHLYRLQTGDFPRLCLKLDAEGMVVRDSDLHEVEIPSSAKTPVVDVCGAGDQVLAAIGVGLSRGKNWIDACQFASVAAGIKCGRVGAAPTTSSDMLGSCG